MSREVKGFWIGWSSALIGTWGVLAYQHLVLGWWHA